MAPQVVRRGPVDDVVHEGAQRRDPAFEEDVPVGKAQGRDRGGGARKKVVRPSHRREMAKRAVSECGVCIQVAPGVWHQRVILSLRAHARRREHRSGQLAAAFDRQPPQLGLWPVLPVFAQGQGLSMEPQAFLPHLKRAGAQLA